MKNQIKNLLKIVSVVTLFVFSSCENEKEFITSSNSSIPRGVTNYVKISDVPSIIPSIIKFNEDYKFLKDYQRLGDYTSNPMLNLNLDLNKIIEYISANGYKTYSINILKEFTLEEEKYFENLNIYEKNGQYEMLIVKYDEIDDLKEFNFATFTGKVEIYSYDYQLQTIIDYQNGSKAHLKFVGQLGCLDFHVYSDGSVMIVDNCVELPGGTSGGSAGIGTNPSSGNSSGTGNNPSGTSGTTINTSNGTIYVPNVPLNSEQFIYSMGSDVYTPYQQIRGEIKEQLEHYITINFHDQELKSEIRSTLSNTNLYLFSGLSQSNQQSILNYWIENEFAFEIQGFVSDVVNLTPTETNQEEINKLINLSFLVNDSADTLFTDEFAISLDPYVDMDLGNPPPDITPNMFGIKIFLNYIRLRELNPEWSKGKCIWYATRDLVHLSLDAFGLIPVAGEVADLVNGVLYTIEGERLNATLSYASAVPILGWATTGTKFGLKVINIANDVNTKVKLVWKVLPDGVIHFGSASHCRTTLRKVLGMAVGDARQAHHIIPLNLQTNQVVQKAAKSAYAFHLNEALNGIPLSTVVHSGSHAHYDGLINQKLLDFIEDYPSATPNQCYTKINQIIQQIRTAIDNNPGVPINQLNF